MSLNSNNKKGVTHNHDIQPLKFRMLYIFFFNESYPRPIQSSSRNVCVLQVFCALSPPNVFFVDGLFTLVSLSSSY